MKGDKKNKFKVRQLFLYTTSNFIIFNFFFHIFYSKIKYEKIIFP